MNEILDIKLVQLYSMSIIYSRYPVAQIIDWIATNQLLNSRRYDLNAELGRLCPFSAPRGHTFSTCPPRFPQGYFMDKFSPLTSIKFLPPMPPHPKVIQIIRP